MRVRVEGARTVARDRDRAGGPPGTPGWVKGMGAVVVLLVLVLVALGLLGRGHGRRRHLLPGGHRSAPAATAASPSLPG